MRLLHGLQPAQANPGPPSQAQDQPRQLTSSRKASSTTQHSVRNGEVALSTEVAANLVSLETEIIIGFRSWQLRSHAGAMDYYTS